MATKLQELRGQFATPFNRETVVRLMQPLFNRFPHLALVSGVLGVLPGYIFLLMFPLAAVVLGWQLPIRYVYSGTVEEGLLVAAQSIAVLFALGMTFFLLRTSGTPPRGLLLDHSMAPALFDMIAELEEAYGRAVVHRIIIRHEYAVRVIKTPSFGLPFFTTNTLIIGLPVLLCLPPRHFKALLARRIGQGSGKHNYLSGWLFQLRTIWRSYRDHYATRRTLAARLCHAFFKAYVPLNNALSFFAARLDELEADRYALEVINDRDFIEVMSQEIVTRKFLQRVYWPKVYQLARRAHGKPCLPFHNMSRVIRKGLRREEMRHWIENAMRTPACAGHYFPSLPQRLENIGHTKPAMPVEVVETAAASLFNPKSLKQIIVHMDQQWLTRLQTRKGGKKIRPPVVPATAAAGEFVKTSDP